MTARNLAIALALVGLAQPALAADHAQGRGGGSSGPSGHSVAPASPGRQHTGAVSPGGSSLTLAERRHPQASVRNGGFYNRGFYRPYYSPFFGGSFYYGWPYYYDPFFYGGYYGGFYGAPGYYYGYRYHDRASLRVLVNPDKTRVFVDGYYAGIADDFDGLFQRLHVSPGRHEIALKLEGYRTHRLKIYVAGGATLKIQHDMIKGSGEDPVEDLAGDAGASGERYDDRDRYGDRDRELSEEPPDRPRPEARGLGRLRLNVQPPDASVYVDGQFRGTGRQVGEIELPPGRHRVEIVRPGFRTDDRDVDVDPGKTRELSVELQRP
jgi:hypothetical protein